MFARIFRKDNMFSSAMYERRTFVIMAERILVPDPERLICRFYVVFGYFFVGRKEI